MEEADILGDRVAILARGQLQCCGSSLYLKVTPPAQCVILNIYLCCYFNLEQIRSGLLPLYSQD